MNANVLQNISADTVTLKILSHRDGDAPIGSVRRMSSNIFPVMQNIWNGARLLELKCKVTLTWRSSFGATSTNTPCHQRISIGFLRKHLSRHNATENPQTLVRRSFLGTKFHRSARTHVFRHIPTACQTSLQSFYKHTMTLWTISAGSVSGRVFRRIPANTKHLSEVTQTPRKSIPRISIRATQRHEF